ncbi:MAG: hypothetical protein CBB97_14800 [Candidatus Endolissoclinum sp. TMED37]|nr:MAG: hypothetical protein CBB97_14800 [Candidatus Endolissoclinum sp. TMED37]|tara:strand:+ start:900 stop:1460 length:561 start_codon:yes stop_codon:yes gene_type:complete
MSQSTITWHKDKLPFIPGLITLINDKKESAQMSNDALWLLSNVHAQESVNHTRPRFFHTFVNSKELIHETICNLRLFWENKYAPNEGYWDMNDPLIYKYGTQYLIHIPDMQFKNASRLLIFCNQFNEWIRNTKPHLELPIGHLEKTSYRWPLVNQTLGEKKIPVLPIQGTGVNDIYNSAVIIYDQE